MKPQFPHLPPMPAPGNFALHSSDHAPTRTPTALHPAARPSLSHHRCSGWLPHSPLALVTTAKLLAGCHAPVLNAPTMLLVVGLGVAAPHPLQVSGSKQYELAGYSLSRSFRTEPPAHTHGSSPASAGATPLPFAPPGAASSCP